MVANKQGMSKIISLPRLGEGQGGGIPGTSASLGVRLPSGAEATGKKPDRTEKRVRSKRERQEANKSNVTGRRDQLLWNSY